MRNALYNEVGGGWKGREKESTRNAERTERVWDKEQQEACDELGPGAKKFILFAAYAQGIL